MYLTEVAQRHCTLEVARQKVVETRPNEEVATVTRLRRRLRRTLKLNRASLSLLRLRVHRYALTSTTERAKGQGASARSRIVVTYTTGAWATILPPLAGHSQQQTPLRRSVLGAVAVKARARISEITTSLHQCLARVRSLLFLFSRWCQ